MSACSTGVSPAGIVAVTICDHLAAMSARAWSMPTPARSRAITLRARSGRFGSPAIGRSVCIDMKKSAPPSACSP